MVICCKCKKEVEYVYGNKLCRKCNTEYSRNHYSKNREYRCEYVSNFQRAKRSGLTKEQLKKILSQSQVCEICKVSLELKRGNNKNRERKKKYLCLDHNHKTNKFRGILCNTCNQLLGNCFDNIEVLKSAIKYIEEKNK